MISPDLIAAAMTTVDEPSESETEITNEVTEEPTETDAGPEELDNEESDDAEGGESDDTDVSLDVDLSLEDSSESEVEESTDRWSDRFPPDKSLDSAVQERVRQQIDGVQKAITREIEATYGPIVNIEQNLRSPERYEAQLQRLAEDLTAIHGVPVRVSIGDDQTYDVADEYELPEVKQVKTKLTDAERRLAELEAKLGTREAEERQAAKDAKWLSTKGDSAVKLAAQELGLKISAQEALNAVKSWPTKQPIDAIFAEYGRTHKVASAKPKKGGAVLPNSSQGTAEAPKAFVNGKTDFKELARMALLAEIGAQ